MITADEILELGRIACSLARIGLREPLDIYAYAREPYYKFLYLMTATGRFKTCVELGTFIGVGALHLAIGNPRSWVYTIDRDPTTYQIDHEAYGIRNLLRVQADTSAVLPESVIPTPIDLLFVDGDHSYEGVRRDLATWLPRVRPGGVVLFDDRHWEGDTRLWDELVAEHGDRALVLDPLHWSGFGALIVPEAP